MEWIESLNEAIVYMEAHMTEKIDYKKVAKIACCSPYHFQRMFAYIAGIPLSEYIRRRKMSLAAVDLQRKDEKIIDIALKYGYASPTAFNRAFQSIHGIAPSRIKEDGVLLKSYPPISFKLILEELKMALYNQIGLNYDETRRPDPYLVQKLVDHLKINDNHKYIDIACGSGNYTNAIAKKGGEVYGVDISDVMLKLAKEKNANVNWFLGDVEKLPFEKGMFYGATCTLSVHHFDALYPAFCEIFRVLKQGNFVIFTSTKEQMEHYWLNEYFPNAMKASIQQMPSLDAIEKNLKDAGFTSIKTDIYTVSNALQDLFLYSGKHRPEMYLNPDIRAGISTFANLAMNDEIELGCKRIAADIESGKISKVIDSYTSKNELGDYMFVVASKNPLRIAKSTTLKVRAR